MRLCNVFVVAAVGVEVVDGRVEEGLKKGKLKSRILYWRGSARFQSARQEESLLNFQKCSCVKGCARVDLTRKPKHLKKADLSLIFYPQSFSSL